MSEITFEVIDMAGNITAISLPSDQPMPVAVSQIVAAAHLPLHDAAGTAFNYRLFSRRLMEVLHHDGTLMSAGVLDGDQLRVVPAPISRSLEFEMLTEPEVGARLPIPPVPYLTLGRGSNNDLGIRAPVVSRQHGEIIWQDGLHIYRDLNSANGSAINMLAVTEPMPLSIGSVLKLGEVVQMRYQPISPVREKSPPDDDNFALMFDTQLPTGLRPLPRAAIFVSLTETDYDIAQPIVNALRQANFFVFWAAEIPPGTNVEDAIENNITYSDIMVIFMTRAALDDQSLSAQRNQFIVDRKPIIVLRDAESAVPNSLQDYPVIELTDDIDYLMERLTTRITNALR